MMAFESRNLEIFWQIWGQFESKGRHTPRGLPESTFVSVGKKSKLSDQYRNRHQQ